jgi:CRP/FNR family transcriptional regulator, cyclic AMP receptor protein
MHMGVVGLMLLGFDAQDRNAWGVSWQTPMLRRRRSAHAWALMSSSHSLYQRRRPATAQEIEAIPWMHLLQPQERKRAIDALQVTHACVGEYVSHAGKPVTYWLGLIEGLLKMSADNVDGLTMTFTGVPPGGWFGEGTCIKREPYRYNIQALRKSVIAGIPLETFQWLLDNSLGFNRFIMNQLNERLGQFIAAREIDRISNPDVRVARSLAALFNPVLYPAVGEVLRITQQELAYLVGLSRQRVNEALAHLEHHGAIQVEYGGLRVMDLQALRQGLFVASKRKQQAQGLLTRA